MANLEIEALDSQYHDFPRGFDWHGAHFERARILNRYLFNAGIMLGDAGYGLRVKVPGEGKYEIHPFVKNDSSMPWVPKEFEWGVTQDITDDTGNDWFPLAVGYSEGEGKKRLHVDIGGGEMSRTRKRGEGASISDSGHLRLCFFRYEMQYFIDLDEKGRCVLENAPHDFYLLHTQAMGARQYMELGGVHHNTIEAIFRRRNPMWHLEQLMKKKKPKEEFPWLDMDMYGHDLFHIGNRLARMNPYELFLKYTIGYRKGQPEKVVGVEAGLFLGNVRNEPHEKYNVQDVKFDAILFNSGKRGVSPSIVRMGLFDPNAVNKAQKFHGVDISNIENDWGGYFAGNKGPIPVPSEGKEYTLPELVESRKAIRRHVLNMLQISEEEAPERKNVRTDAQLALEALERLGGLNPPKK